jgi:hypothetical protein
MLNRWRAAEAGLSQLRGDAGLDVIVSNVLDEAIDDVFWGGLVMDARIRN